MSVELQRRPFTADEYEALGRAGILDEDDRVELIEGEIVETAPIGKRHSACVARLNRLFSERAAEQAIVWVQSQIRLSDFSQPEPDVTLLTLRDDFYEDRHPGPADVLLLIEVADASLEADREIKIPLYGRSGVREAWLVDLQGRAVEVYRSPSADGYDAVERVAPPGILRPQALEGVEVSVEEVLG